MRSLYLRDNSNHCRKNQEPVYVNVRSSSTLLTQRRQAAPTQSNFPGDFAPLGLCVKTL